MVTFVSEIVVPTGLDHLSCDRAIEGLEAVFAAIDRSYDTVASHFGFDCKGCDHNCCETLFFHYTILEFLYLRKGFTQMDRAERQRIIRLSEEYVREFEGAADLTGKRTICSVNHKGLCALYRYRPMICRLHGVPYTLDISSKRQGHGMGCHRFMVENPRPEDGCPKIDRTTLYRKVARLEMDLRRQTHSLERYRYTVADVFMGLTP